LAIAEVQYRQFPEEFQALVDRRLGWLLEAPTADPAAVYNSHSDQWSVPLGDQGFLFYAVVNEPSTLIVLRLVVGLT
jgi:hypothetical protein